MSVSVEPAAHGEQEGTQLLEGLIGHDVRVFTGCSSSDGTPPEYGTGTLRSVDAKLTVLLDKATIDGVMADRAVILGANVRFIGVPAP